MKSFHNFFIFIGLALLIETLLFIKSSHAKIDGFNSTFEKPSVLIVCLIRNKALTLPFFLTYLHEQDYPKNKISFWLKTDHNEDNSHEILETWVNHTRDLYHAVHYHFDDGEKLRSDEANKLHWSNKRFEDLINMKEAALEFARESTFDFVFYVDADVFLTYPSTLQELINLNLPIVAPMVISEGMMYSNFWCGMTSEYYYESNMEYDEIRHFKKQGEFSVPMVFGAVLIDIRTKSSDNLTFNKTKLNSFYNEKKYNGPIDDIITFSISALFSRNHMTISNTRHYGFILSPMPDADEIILMANTKAAIVRMYGKINTLSILQKFIAYSEKSRLTFSEIYMINLKRRPERRLQKEVIFQELGIDCTFIEAVDGRELTEQIIVDKELKILPNYKDWDNGRYFTMGEVGCFLSHYKIWEKIVKEQQKEVLIFEDDIKLEHNFNSKIVSAMEEARKLGGYDLIYINRAPRLRSEENFLPNSINFLKAKNSFHANGYVLTLKGAEKLLAAKPLEKLVPVDAFLSIMYDSYDNYEWMTYFEKRDLVAWSVVENLASIFHYWHNVNTTADRSYISDTEHSKIIKKEIVESLYAIKRKEEL